NGSEDIVRHLIKGGADLKLANGDGLTATMIAIVNDRLDLAAELIDLGSDPNDGSLFYAVQMRDATTDWYAHDGSELRPDHANKRTALDLVELLLDKGADPNKPFVGELHWSAMCCDPAENASPFYRAAAEADVEALKLLLAHGAKVSWTPSKAEGKRAANTNVGTPALVAAVNGGRGVGQSGGPGNLREGPPPFREPSDRTPADAVRLLLGAGADANAAAPDGTTPLHAAAKYRKLDVIRALANAGAKLDALNAQGLSPLDVALGRLAKGAPAKPAAPSMDDGNAPTREQVAGLLRDLMKTHGVPVVLHGEAPAPQLAGNTQ
ncbi:MAG TPA: ankyrin repeat domain-containing protein, partial [Gammaproteobacteria bacterium]|nr:ankyrin repeat domain-containing protein [Gammaproteobacteria bacterium]